MVKILDPVKVEEACEKLDREHISYWLTTKKSTPIEVKNLTDLLQRIVDRKSVCLTAKDYSSPF